MAKAPDAFRTISEVANWLGTQAHVLRFWESKFEQIAPVKRAGGRRYYRREDMQLIGGIKKLLHDDGMTIKGVQKLIKDQGTDAVCLLSPELVFEDKKKKPRKAKPKVAKEEAAVEEAPKNVIAFTMNPLPMRKKPVVANDAEQPLLFPEMAEWDASDAGQVAQTATITELTPSKPDSEAPAAKSAEIDDDAAQESLFPAFASVQSTSVVEEDSTEPAAPARLGTNLLQKDPELSDLVGKTGPITAFFKRNGDMPTNTQIRNAIAALPHRV